MLARALKGEDPSMNNGDASLDDRTQITLTKLRYDHEIARLGLQGTLWGAWASLAALVVIVIAQVMTERYVVQGWAFAVMAAVMAMSVTFYGAFIFDRALNISAKVEKEGLASFSAGAGGATR
jgi:hypothetical protein